MKSDSDKLEIFVEQAEYIESEDFEQWTIEHPDEHLILRKLSQAGAKLITGPRGCGKTTLLLKAFRSLCADPSQRTLPIYVNFKVSLKLEPYYKKSANAPFLFQQWLYYKIYVGLFETLDKIGKPLPADLAVTQDSATTRIQELELGRGEKFTEEATAILPSILERDINNVLDLLDYRRCVLLLDDAAHAFSVEQQRDFFDFFRLIKSKVISPKAAIYPGVTMYSPTFHVGHDAEEIDAWIKPDSSRYLPFMKKLLENRLSQEVWEQLNSNMALLELLSFASFGIPRALLNMVRSLYRADDDESELITLDYSRASVLRAIKASYENTLSIFNSLGKKLPMYEKFIAAGRQILDRCVAAIKEYNRRKNVEDQSVTIAVKKPVTAELAKIFGFFQYAGLLLPSGEISRGEKGVFELFVIHYANLIDSNALIVAKAVNPSLYVQAFQHRQAKEFTRVTSATLLNNQSAAEVLALSLPPCHVCNTPRISEAARFCLNCGQPLKAVSVFETLIEADISELPLTETRLARIKQHSSLRTVKDILLDHEHRQLRRVPRIGPYWASRIYSYAEEYLG